MNPADTPVKRPLVLVIPVRNESANVPDLLRMVASIPHVHVVFVDHASSDDTNALLVAGGAIVVTCDSGGGFGRAVKAGVMAASQMLRDMPDKNGEGYIGWLPGNLKSSPVDAAKLADTLDASRAYDSAYVKARRVGRPFREWGPSAFAGVILSVWGLGPYWEVGGTPTIVPATRADVLLRGPDGLEFETYVITAMRREGLRMVRLSAAFGKRVHGASHWNRGLGSQISLLRRLMREISRTRAESKL